MIFSKTKRTGLFLLAILSASLITGCGSLGRNYGHERIAPPIYSIATPPSISEIKQLPDSVFDSVQFSGVNVPAIAYRLFHPQQETSAEKYPLVVVFHGSDAIGTDNVTQLGVLAKLFAIEATQADYPAYVLAPQFPTRSSDYTLDTARNVLSSAPRPCLESVFQLIDSLVEHLNIDERRIYVVGFSMGGSTVINALAAQPSRFAAGISLAGIPQFELSAETANLPIWLIHGTADTENPPDSDRQFYRERRKNTRFWELEGIEHSNILVPIIRGDALPKWLFQHQKTD